MVFPTDAQWLDNGPPDDMSAYGTVWQVYLSGGTFMSVGSRHGH